MATTTMHNWQARATGITAFLALAGSCLLPGLTLVRVATPDAPAKYTGLPYGGGKPIDLPGIVQAEAYDIAPGAANGISFNYNSPATPGPLRTSGDCIGLARFGTGHVSITGQPENPDQVYAGWTHAGEWLKYTVHVKEAGVYRLGGQYSAATTGAAISVTFTPATGPALTTGPVEIPTTAGYQPGVEVYHVWEKLDNMATITVPQGNAIMTVKIEKGAGLNLDYFTLTKKP